MHITDARLYITIDNFRLVFTVSMSRTNWHTILIAKSKMRHLQSKFFLPPVWFFTTCWRFKAVSRNKNRAVSLKHRQNTNVKIARSTCCHICFKIRFVIRKLNNLDTSTCANLPHRQLRDLVVKVLVVYDRDGSVTWYFYFYDSIIKSLSLF